MKPQNIFTLAEVEKIGACLELGLKEEFIPAWEFSTLIPAKREEAIELVRRWPNVNIAEEKTWLITYGILANLWGYPHGETEWLERVIDEDKCIIKTWFNKIKTSAFVPK